jgi:phosphoglycerate kinase
MLNPLQIKKKGDFSVNKKSIKDVAVQGKRVLVRADFNVPLDEQRHITDDTRIRASLPTIEHLIKEGARVILASHLGRPKGQVDPKYSLAPVAQRLSERLGQDVPLAQDCIGEAAQEAVEKLKDGQVLLLENVRFHKEEEKNDPEFAREMASLAEIFVNDAFGTAHRAHASTEGVTHYIPAVAGFLMQKEVEFMGNALEHPERPFVAIIGGAKVSDKIGVIENLLEKVDALVIGGGMANTFLKAQGYKVGKSLLEEDKLDLAKLLIEKAKSKGVKLELPIDVVVAKAFAADAPHRTAELSGIEDDEMALDIGPASAERFGTLISTARTVIWNGPMGVFEMDTFAKGTERVAQAVAACQGTTIVGGGDSVAAVEKLGVADRMTHISTGGGASLEFLEGKVLPGVAALSEA